MTGLQSLFTYSALPLLLIVIFFNPFTVPACTISGLKNAHTHIPAKQYILLFYNKSTFSTVRFVKNLFMC